MLLHGKEKIYIFTLMTPINEFSFLFCFCFIGYLLGVATGETL